MGVNSECVTLLVPHMALTNSSNDGPEELINNSDKPATGRVLFGWDDTGSAAYRGSTTVHATPISLRIRVRRRIGAFKLHFGNGTNKMSL